MNAIQVYEGDGTNPSHRELLANGFVYLGDLDQEIFLLHATIVPFAELRLPGEKPHGAPWPYRVRVQDCSMRWLHGQMTMKHNIGFVDDQLRHAWTLREARFVFIWDGDSNSLSPQDDGSFVLEAIGHLDRVP
jgi:hypothetical protein